MMKANPDLPEELPDDAAFTLTEMVVSLVVAGVLIVGVGDLTRLTARAYSRVTENVENVRTVRSLQGWMSFYSDVDPDTLLVSASSASAERGSSVSLQFDVAENAPGEDDHALHISVAGRINSGLREVALLDDSVFVYEPASVLRLVSVGEAYSMIASPIYREVPFNCQYDPVGKRCR